MDIYIRTLIIFSFFNNIGEEAGIRLSAGALCAYLPVIDTVLRNFPNEGEKEQFPLEIKDLAYVLLK